MGLVKTTDEQSRLSHIKSLIAVACVDGNYDAEEKQIIKTVAARIGLSEQELNRAEKDGVQVEFKIPADTDLKLELMYDLVLVMMADKHMDQGELKLCKSFAERLGYDDVQIALLITSGIANIKRKETRETAIANMARALD